MSQTPGDIPRRFPSSPRWSKNTKLFVTACVLAFLVAVLVTFRQLALYVLLALVFSLVIRPIVDFLDNRLTKVPRWLTTLLIYLLVFGSLLAAPISRIPTWIRQVAEFLNALPNLLELVINNVTAFLSEPIVLFRGLITIPVDELSVDQIQQYLGDIVTFVASGLTSFINSIIVIITSGAIGFLSSTVFVLFLSFYFTKDGHILAQKLLRLAPDQYHDDMHFMFHRSNLIWGAFLRGQLILMLTIGVITFIAASILGLPNPVALAIVAGSMEIIPYAGPLLAAVPALLLAWFQADVSWLGTLTGPLWFTVITAATYWLIQQIENYFLVPRIMGHQLKLHPAFVFIGALAGWQLAGIFGIFLAAPLIATIRLIGAFIYGKLTDQAIADMVELPDEAVNSDEVVTEKPATSTGPSSNSGETSGQAGTPIPKPHKNKLPTRAQTGD